MNSITRPSKRQCSFCDGRGFYGTPGKQCELCHGDGNDFFAPTLGEENGNWKFEAIYKAVPYCISCEKEGHRTDECWSTHGFNTPREMEIARLSWIANGQLKWTKNKTSPELFAAMQHPGVGEMTEWMNQHQALYTEKKSPEFLAGFIAGTKQHETKSD